MFVFFFISGANKSHLISVSQKLKGFLPSSLEENMPDDLLETLYRLLDLVSMLSDICSLVI